MKALKAPPWFTRLLARWRGASPGRGRGRTDAGTPLREIDIDLSAADAAVNGEVTDYDVHSLGDPIDPPATARRAGR